MEENENPRAMEHVRDGVTPAEWEWIQKVVEGASYVDAVGSHITRIRIRQSAALEMLDKEPVRRRLIKGLLLAGQAERAQEVMTYAANLATLAAIEEGSEKAALAVLGSRAPKPAPAKPQLPPMPEARSLGKKEGEGAG